MNWPSKLFISLSAIGILAAIYHASQELAFTPSNACNLSAVFSCESVFASGYGSLFGVPFYVYGLVWFPLTLILGVVATHHLRFQVLFLMVGNIFTMYLWYLDIFVINAYCVVCLSMYGINYVLTALTFLNMSIRSTR